MTRQLEAFAAAVRGVQDRTSLATSADGLVVMAVIDAIRRSAAQNGSACRPAVTAAVAEKHS
jgi:hypothetical protein